MSIEKENLLLERISRKRDIGAFDAVFTQWYQVLVVYACNFVDMADAENVVQDVMTYLWENARYIRLQTSLRAYLKKSVKNRCLNLVNRGMVREKVVSAIGISVIDVVQELQPYSMDELARQLHQALAQLPEAQRKAFEYSRFKGLTYNEIAVRTGVSEKTVEYRISHAIGKLRVLLKDYK